jgi:hypothetical protein
MGLGPVVGSTRYEHVRAHSISFFIPLSGFLTFLQLGHQALGTAPGTAPGTTRHELLGQRNVAISSLHMMIRYVFEV